MPRRLLVLLPYTFPLLLGAVVGLITLRTLPAHAQDALTHWSFFDQYTGTNVDVTSCPPPIPGPVGPAGPAGAASTLAGPAGPAGTPGTPGAPGVFDLQTLTLPAPVTCPALIPLATVTATQLAIFVGTTVTTVPSTTAPTTTGSIIACDESTCSSGVVALLESFVNINAQGTPSTPRKAYAVGKSIYFKCNTAGAVIPAGVVFSFQIQ